MRAVGRGRGWKWNPKAQGRVCSDHFVGGWPSDFPEDDNYRPSLKLHLNKPQPKESPRHDQNVARLERISKRRELRVSTLYYSLGFTKIFSCCVCRRILEVEQSFGPYFGCYIELEVH